MGYVLYSKEKVGLSWKLRYSKRDIQRKARVGYGVGGHVAYSLSIFYLIFRPGSKGHVCKSSGEL